MTSRRIHLHSATEAQRRTVTDALWTAHSVYKEHAFDFAARYAFHDRNANWLRVAHQFLRQADETAAVARKMRLI